MSAEPRRLSLIRSSILDSSLESSHSMSSLSIDSNHSPQGQDLPRRVSSRASDRVQLTSESLRNTTSTPRRQSSDLTRDFSNLSMSSTARASPQRMSNPPQSPRLNSPVNRESPRVNSPLERRFPRRLVTRNDSTSGPVQPRVDEEETESLASHDRDTPSKTLEERLREADDMGGRRSARRSIDLQSQTTPVRRYASMRVQSGYEDRESSQPPDDSPNTTSTRPGSSGGRVGKVRQPIPPEFQNGGFVSVSLDRMLMAVHAALSDRARQCRPQPVPCSAIA